MEQYAPGAVDGFVQSWAVFESVVGLPAGREAAALSHADLEDQLSVRGRELARCLLQDHLSLRALRERRVDRVVGADGVARGAAERGHERALLSVFGQVRVERIAYRAAGHPVCIRRMRR